MIIMAVDYGDARTGIAICDKTELLASPVTVIKESYAPKLAAKVAALAAEKKAELIVVGYPINMNGTKGPRAEKCQAFAELLQSEYGLTTALRDERLTTVEAHKALNATNTRGRARKETVDAVAATLILEDYLAFRKNSK
jgi:putative holliday junction resolvase